MVKSRGWDVGVLDFAPSAQDPLLPLTSCVGHHRCRRVLTLGHPQPTALPTPGDLHLCIEAQLDPGLVFEISSNLITFINSILLRLSQSY